jgi:2-polyprenyl-6-methoxyphenol hydroxylase-like FAD-dependent oxidoreductase
MTSPNANYDVLVVGARIAGSVTASLLGEAGYRVLLVDATSFPSDTISTHFFRGAGLVSVLERLGVLDTALALRPRHSRANTSSTAGIRCQPWKRHRTQARSGTPFR